MAHTKDILEKTKLINVFMHDKNPDYCFINGALIDKANACYHTSWDWIMTVVEKIESLHYEVLITSNYTVVNKMNSAIYLTNIYSESGMNKLQALFKTIIYFINWYNETIKQNGI